MRIAFLLFLFCFLSACRDCPDAAGGNENNVVLISISQYNFYERGYRTVYVPEREKKISINEYEEHLNLPLSHSTLTTTFILRGDTVAPDTIQFGDYNARPELYNEECGYRLEVDKGKVLKSTFSNDEIIYFDERINTLYVEIIL